MLRRPVNSEPFMSESAAPNPQADADRLEIATDQAIGRALPVGIAEFAATSYASQDLRVKDVSLSTLLQRRNVHHGKTRWASTFIDRSYPWQALHLANEICEQRRGIVPSPHERQRQRHVQIDHG